MFQAPEVNKQLICLSNYSKQMEYQHALSEQELCELRVFCDDELNSEDAHLGQTLVNEMDYVGRKLTTNNSVPGNIHREKYLNFWRDELEAHFVIDQLVNGYSLPFAVDPPPSFEKNNSSALKDMPFVRQEVKRLEQLGCIKKSYSPPQVCAAIVVRI